MPKLSERPFPDWIPSFNDPLVNVFRPGDGPTRFVRVVRSHGVISWRVTDGAGSFWTIDPRAAERVEPDTKSISSRLISIAANLLTSTSVPSPLPDDWPKRPSGAAVARRIEGTVEWLKHKAREVRACADASRKIEAERDSLRDFAQAVMRGFPETHGADGFEAEDLAVEHGLLTPVEVTEPCQPEGCWCAEYHGDFDGGVTCYRRTVIFTGEDE